MCVSVGLDAVRRCLGDGCKGACVFAVNGVGGKDVWNEWDDCAFLGGECRRGGVG